MALEIDHIIPVSLGGESISDNLCLAWRNCNSFKLAFVSGIDPETGDETALFNPRESRWDMHFAWTRNGTEIIGLTAIGRATIDRLRMNRADAVAARTVWVEAGWRPPLDP